jgi:dissimilatory sulfite reductase (desulfoviridin) alpha/beta subunit
VPADSKSLNEPPREGTLDLELPEADQKLAIEPINLTNPKGKDSTHTLTEAPAPMGAYLNSNPFPLPIEPVLVTKSQLEKSNPPFFLTRLSETPENRAYPTIKKEGPLSWSLTNGDTWPVFVRRHLLSKPTSAFKLSEISRIARRFGAGKLCLTSYGDLDIFFNDRNSLQESFKVAEAAEEELFTLPAQITFCRGLMLCPLAALDTLAIKEGLSLALRKNKNAQGKPQVHISIHGCMASGGQDCGVYEFTDLRIIGKRERAPILDQELLTLSPHLDTLLAGCPTKALSLSETEGKVLNLDKKACCSCGYCLSIDPSFQFPSPQESYFSLEASGRRLIGAQEFLPPKVLVSKVKDNYRAVFDKIAELIALFRQKRAEKEILYDFVQRIGFFSDDLIKKPKALP